MSIKCVYWLRLSRYFCLMVLMVGGYFTLPMVVAAPMTFQSPDEEQRFQALAAELRCLVCQNQSLADSHAELAQDLREEVYRLMQAGSTDAQIIDFLVQRYGHFVIYRPPFQRQTWILWLAPFFLALLAIAFLVYRVKFQRPEPPLTALQQQQLARLLHENSHAGHLPQEPNSNG